MDNRAHTMFASEVIISRVANVLREEQITSAGIESAVDKAGVGRNEVIARFGSMHGLILEMVSMLCRDLAAPLEQDLIGRAMRDVLVDFGTRLANTYSVSHLRTLYRIALSEATCHSGVGREFFERGPGQLAMRLARYFERSIGRTNRVRAEDAKRLATEFLSLLGDYLEFSDWMIAAGTDCTKNYRDAVVEAVDVFCTVSMSPGGAHKGFNNLLARSRAY